MSKQQINSYYNQLEKLIRFGGVVYTPSEIVKFMIESTDWLLEKHFGKSLGDKNVEILHPATGTGIKSR